ncbi:helix-turn-helix transcriptional regulator [Pandoraea terrae]|uniref:Helix-turn-helix transcriptional regulator n=1 Tax=Pandoraea terrae TaxID=1537710 RepID=A0A5E4UI41_9BURK|nr:response regulator transcription factor [Pandoraea terrae]VVD98708.1 helix-turn-helix transcriptional regulator [Pandoraea terrae]
MRVLVVGEDAPLTGGLTTALQADGEDSSVALRHAREIQPRDWAWLRESPVRRCLVVGESVARAGLELLCVQASEHLPVIPVIVTGHTLFPDEMIRWLQLGVSACLPWPAPAVRTRAVIDLVLAGGRFVPDESLAALLMLWRQESLGGGPLAAAGLPVFPLGGDKAAQLAESALLGISQRQYEILALLSRGLSIKTICQQLLISEGTAKTHVSALYRRLGARNRGEAIYIAAQRGAKRLFET